VSNIPDGIAYTTDTQDSENLTHTCHCDALEMFLDDNHQTGETRRQTAARVCPVKLTAWKREEISDSSVNTTAEALVEMSIDHFDEEYGPFDDAPDIDEDARKTCVGVVEAAVKAFWSRCHVWRCKEAGSVTLTAEEVLTQLA